MRHAREDGFTRNTPGYARIERDFVRPLAFPVLWAYGIMVDPVTGEGGLPCLWEAMFGWECPGCGLSRAVSLIMRGRVGDAMDMNWLVVPIVLAALFLTLDALGNSNQKGRWQWLS